MGQFVGQLGAMVLVPMVSAVAGLGLKRLSRQRWANEDLSLAVELIVACLVLQGTFLVVDLSWLLTHNPSREGILVTQHLVLLTWHFALGALLGAFALAGVLALRGHDMGLGGSSISRRAAVFQTGWAGGGLMVFFVIDYFVGYLVHSGGVPS